jgi:riboflavin synthase
VFTGIVQSVGRIVSISNMGRDRQLKVDLGSLDAKTMQPGDSIAVDGACLTAIGFDANTFIADVSVETLKMTTLGKLTPESRVNLEPALTPSSRLGGHLVSGHVDGTSEILERHHEARSEHFTIRAPESLCHYIASKGSVCVQGVSLTVNNVDKDTFSVNIVPHTLAMTNLGDCVPGTIVNLEIDVIARYLERLLNRDFNSDSTPAVSEAFLRQAGFIDTGD